MFQQLKIQELLRDIILLQRDLKKTLEHTEKFEALSKNFRFLKSHKYSKALENIDKFGLEPSLQKFKATSDEEVIHWDFIQRSVYSAESFNPRRRMERAYREGIEDVIREVKIEFLVKMVIFAKNFAKFFSSGFDN